MPLTAHDRLTAVRTLAADAHARRGQQYRAPGGPRPYVEHLDAVVAELREAGVTDVVRLAAGYGHDLIEDTDLDSGAVLEAALIPLLGPEEARRTRIIVEAVTLPPATREGPHATRLGRFATTLPVTRDTPGATVVKLGDRAANLAAGIRWADAGHPRLLQRYAAEHPSFRAALWRPACAAVDPAETALWARVEALVARAAAY